MADYKDTLNLPQTDFPMKANLAQREPGILKNWQDMDLYQRLRAAGAGRLNLFCMMALLTRMAIFI